MFMKKSEIILSPVNSIRLEDGTETFYRDYKRENEVILATNSDMKTRLV